MSKNEKWKQIQFPRAVKLQKKYMVSNTGKVASYTDKPADAGLLQLKEIEGYKCISLRMHGVKKSLFAHRLVAEAFLKPKSSRHTFVLHLDHNRKNNSVDNLRWATQMEQAAHRKGSPLVKKALKNRVLLGGVFSKVLTEAKVKKLKEEIWDPKRKKSLKKLAEQYNISEMNIYRIKSGEFWYRVKVKHEPDSPKYLEYVKALKQQKKN
ncbi:MAG: HNH endonuclease signature motif containing protein [Bacteroidia bacterium]